AMNVSGRRTRCEPPETPHFFKIILSDTLQSGKLMIPRRFIAKYGNRLPSQLLLKVAGDANWPVELEKCDDSVWICKGWRNFLDYYSISHGHLIVFRYEGGSIFHVLMFDKSASEIEYPLKPVAPEELLGPEMVEIDDVLTELGENTTFPRERRKSPSCLASPEAKGSHSGDGRTSKLKKNVRAYGSSRDFGGMIYFP
ncbi:TF-B3 domain-containing protein, partial [Psidium guajava]